MRPTDTEMHVNVSYDEMMRPQQGPSNPFSDRKLDKMNTLNGKFGFAWPASQHAHGPFMYTGYVQEEYMNDIDFTRQQRSFHVLNYARDPSNLNGDGAGYVGDLTAAQRAHGALLEDARPTRAMQKAQKRKRGDKGELGVFDPDDPEEREEAGRPKEYAGPWARWQEERIEVGGPDEEEYEAPQRVTGRRKVLDEGKREVAFGEEKSVFHGKSLRDYQGRTYMHVPTDADVNLLAEDPPEQCFVPKRCIHTWTGHTKAVSTIRLFPGSGHLMLSASMDSRIKVGGSARPDQLPGRC